MTAFVRASGLALRGRLEETGLVLDAGTLTCLVGPNGSGKTSLLHALAGIGRPDGKVRIGDIDPWAVPPQLRTALFSFLPAAREAIWPIPVRDLIALGFGGIVDRAKLDAMLDLFDLRSLAGRRLDRLSTGERSRVLIARALAPEPSLLLLDEPIANLDPLWQLRLMDDLRRRTTSGGTALVALHDLEMARRYADRLMVMEAGAIVADGNPAKIFSGSAIGEVFGIVATAQGWRPI